MLKSLHLQDFPDVSYIKDDKKLMDEMDMVRDICRTALFIRDKNNLRVRLPLNSLKIIGENSLIMKKYDYIISDEVNVKKIEYIDNIEDFAQFSLKINFKKIGGKFGHKIKEILIAAKNKDWIELENGDIKIVGEILSKDDFEIKLISNDQDKIFPLSNNNSLIYLDINITKELEDEGISRDIVRIIQQNRKESDFDMSDIISIKLFTESDRIKNIIESYDKYIKEQTLTKNIMFIDKNDEEFYVNNIDGNNIYMELKI